MSSADDLFPLLERMFNDADDERETVLSADDSRSVAGEIVQLKRALATRGAIGRAQGMIMERLGADAERAFSLLVRLAQHLNRKLIDICDDLVETGMLPEDPVVPD